MRYTYAYKTSDGTRHEESMDAGSREAVFAALRERGIRPIKVVAADGSKANGEMRGSKRVTALAVLSALCLVLSAVVVIVFALGTDAEEPYASAEADAVREGLRTDYAALRVERLLDCGAVAAMTNVAALFKVAERGTARIERARKETREVFARLAAAERDEGTLRRIRRLYGERMAEIDALEIANANRKFALALLDGNRGKWRVEGGEVVFGDERLARMYRYCLEGISTEASTSRWAKDFSADR